ncbi:MAG TPA: M48 family metallopeptidase, partial [Myxococcota bacterium]|nr:M48 family metallopeptidase [Myxococcota bacterium]
MPTNSSVKVQFAKGILAPVLWLFLVPGIAVLFIHFARAKVRFGPFAGQFAQAHEIAHGALWLGVAAVAGAVLLGCVAFTSREAQLWAFTFGWRALTFVTVVEILLQGALATWLSYWMTAIYLQVYSVKLVAVVGIVALIAAWTALRGMFRKPDDGPPLEAEEVHAADAPRLWTRLRDLATRLRTPPPSHVVAGIDDNFFVTENGVTLASGKLSGRTLYVSLPLLRTLSSSEADAVLAHELAHFQGGDAAASGQLGPHLVRFSNYLVELGSNGATKPAYYLLRMFGSIFELALAK